MISRPMSPQSWNRYGYVLNNPITFNDPTGHVEEQGSGGAGGELNCTKYPQYCNGGKPKSTDELLQMRKEKKEDDGDHTDVVDCTKQACTEEEFIRNLIGLHSEDVCLFLHLEPYMCDSNLWKSLPSSVSLPPFALLFVPEECLGDFWSCYDPDAVILPGFSLSASAPGIYNTGGIELLMMLSDGALSVYDYGGHGNGYGAGANAAAYFGVVANLKNIHDYDGPFGSMGVTVSFFGEGITAFYFWDSNHPPLWAGATQGVAFGWAPGAAASFWGAGTYYHEMTSSAR